MYNAGMSLLELFIHASVFDGHPFRDFYLVSLEVSSVSYIFQCVMYSISAVSVFQNLSLIDLHVYRSYGLALWNNLRLSALILR